MSHLPFLHGNNGWIRGKPFVLFWLCLDLQKE